MILLFHSSATDPLVNILTANQDRLRRPLQVLNVEDFLRDGEILDAIDDREVSIRWTYPGSAPITNSPDVLLINRFNELPKAYIDQFEEPDREYAFSELTAYFNFALHAFPKKIGGATEDGAAIREILRPFQWMRLKNNSPEVRCPDFYSGPARYCHFDRDRSDIRYVYAVDSDNSEVIDSMKYPGDDVQYLLAHTDAGGEMIDVLVLAGGTHVLGCPDLSEIERNHLSVMANMSARALELDIAVARFRRISDGFVFWSAGSWLEDLRNPPEAVSDFVVSRINQLGAESHA